MLAGIDLTQEVLMNGLIAVNPTSAAPSRLNGLRVTVNDLHSRTIGFFSNNKPNAAEVLERVEDLLGDQFRIVARHYMKPSPSVPAKTALLDQIAHECDAVVIGALD